MDKKEEEELHYSFYPSPKRNVYPCMKESPGNTSHTSTEDKKSDCILQWVFWFTLTINFNFTNSVKITSGISVCVAVLFGFFFWSPHNASLEGKFDYLLSGRAKNQSSLLWTQLS